MRLRKLLSAGLLAAAVCVAPTAQGGDTFIMFVTWDRNGKLSSQSIHQFGSATLDESSSHYADQTPLFAAMKTKPVLFTEDELKGQIAADYRP